MCKTSTRFTHFGSKKANTDNKRTAHFCGTKKCSCKHASKQTNKKAVYASRTDGLKRMFNH